MGTYLPLFNVSVEHGYFSGGLWDGMDFIPCSATAVLAGRGYILVKQTGNGVGVYYESGCELALRLLAEDTGGLLRFNFRVYARDKSYPNYTGLPATGGGTILYFTNHGKGGKSDGGKMSLSREDCASSADLAKMDDLIQAGVLGEQHRRVPPDFALSIQAAADMDAAGSARDYSIRFAARQSYWKYYLLGNMNRANAYIVDLDSRVEFEPGLDAVLPGNRPSRVFRSKERLAVTERAGYRFQLREPGPGAGRVLVKRLPVAAGSRLGREMIDGKLEIVLENYVNF
jgi:hypothetical protein